IAFMTGGSWTTVNGDLELIANAAGTMAGNLPGIHLVPGTGINSSGLGNISLRGTGGNDITTFGHHGVWIDDAIIAATGAGSVTVEGAGGSGLSSGFNSNHGVFLSNGAELVSNSGPLLVEGQGGSGAFDGNNGVLLISS